MINMQVRDEDGFIGKRIRLIEKSSGTCGSLPLSMAEATVSWLKSAATPKSMMTRLVLVANSTMLPPMVLRPFKKRIVVTIISSNVSRWHSREH